MPHSGLAGPWNRGIIAHQTPHFRRPPKHVNNKGPLVFAQTFCTACFISLENLHIYCKTYVFSNTFEGFRPKCTFRGCSSKYRRTFIVYMFRRPPEVWSLMSDNALISGTGKVGMHFPELSIGFPRLHVVGTCVYTTELTSGSRKWRHLPTIAIPKAIYHYMTNTTKQQPTYKLFQKIMRPKKQLVSPPKTTKFTSICAFSLFLLHFCSYN